MDKQERSKVLELSLQIDNIIYELGNLIDAEQAIGDAESEKIIKELEAACTHLENASFHLVETLK